MPGGALSWRDIANVLMTSSTIRSIGTCGLGLGLGLELGLGLGLGLGLVVGVGGRGRGRVKDEHNEQHRHLSDCLVPRGQRGHELEAEIVETRPRLGGEMKVVVERLSAQKLTQTQTQAWPPESRSC